MLASSEVPQTVGGWAAVALLPGLAVVGWFIRRLVSKADDVAKSQVEMMRAMAVLASEFHTVQVATGKNLEDINDLKTATAVLREQNDRHERWAQIEHERMMTHLEHA